MPPLNYNRSRLDALCDSYRVRRLALYGSVLRGEDTPLSDLDLLVEFEPGAPIGFFELSRLERALGTLFDRKVDLNTPGFLDQSFRSQVIEHAEALYSR